MPQQLKGLFTALCPRCRESAPVFARGQFEWKCSHRQVSIRESVTHRFLTLGKNSAALSHLDDSDNGSYVTTV